MAKRLRDRLAEIEAQAQAAGQGEDAATWEFCCELPAILREALLGDLPDLMGEFGRMVHTPGQGWEAAQAMFSAVWDLNDDQALLSRVMGFMAGLSPAEEKALLHGQARPSRG